MFEDRWYQTEAVDHTFDYLNSGKGLRPVIASPTGSGKTPIIMKLADRLFSYKRLAKTVILSDRKEILRQNFDSSGFFFDGKKTTIFSAGLKQKKIGDITFAGIQTAANYINFFKHIDFIIVDECHLVPPKERGRYGRFLKALNKPTVGLTATPFRHNHGLIYGGKDNFFDGVSYDITDIDGYNRLVSEGYLCRLISKPTNVQFDMQGIGSRGNDFKQDECSDRFDRSEITRKAINRVIRYGKHYNRWLIFAIDIAHAENIKLELELNGIPTVCIHSKMDTCRDMELLRAKNGEYKAIVNVDVLTTGYDDPEIDLIAILRPTKSLIMHVQIAGRGSRVSPTKDHCLILDFPGNFKRLGPINDVDIKENGNRKKKSQPIIKTCENCGCHQPPTAKFCDVCGCEFQFIEQIREIEYDDEIVRKTKKPKKKNIENWYKVTSASYKEFDSKKGGGIIVTYKCGLRSFKEPICLGYKGYAAVMARHWVKFRLRNVDNPSYSVDSFFMYVHNEMFMKTSKILVDETLSKKIITDYEFDLSETI